MKFNFAALLLLATSTDALKLRSNAEMMAEIEAMSMNANMHQVSQREKTQLKTYLQVDLNEYLQNQMDSELFEGVSEQEKSQFIGNFFHFIKCRFQDCNLLQTKARLNMHKKSMEPSPEVSKAEQDEKNLTDWGSGKGNHTPAHNEGHTSLAQVKSKEPSPEVSKAEQDEKNLTDWGSGKGNHTPAHNENQLAQVSSSTDAEKDKKKKMVTNSFPQVEKDLAAEKAKELVKPTQKADNAGDTEPTNVQTKSDIKK